MATATESGKTRSTPAADRVSRGKVKPVTMYGKPATNRHFLFSNEVLDAARDRADEEGAHVSEVLRAGVADYGDKAPTEAVDAPLGAAPALPDSISDTLRDLYTANDQTRFNVLLAQCLEANWPLKALANALAATGTVTMTREGVRLRARKGSAVPAAERAEFGLPPVPAAARRRSSGGRGNTTDMSFRAPNEEYDKAARRASYEGAQMAAVLEGYLRRYASREFDLPPAEPEPAEG